MSQKMFDSDFLKKLEYLSLVSRRFFGGQLLAKKRSRQLGGGVEFADHRNYIVGDDLRLLDWNVYARLGTRLVKRFEEEEDLPIYFFLDCSRSMDASLQDKPALTKFDYARQITAALAYIALSDLDRVSVIAFSAQIVDVFPLTRGKSHILGLLHFLESLPIAEETTNIYHSLNEFIHRKQRAGLAVLVSDFFDPRGFQKAADSLRFRHYEPNLIQIHEEREASPKILGDCQLMDCETAFFRNVSIDKTLLRQYQQKFSAFLESIQKYGLNNGCGCTITTTAVPFDELILKMMGKIVSE